MVVSYTLTGAIWICLGIAVLAAIRRSQGETTIEIGSISLRTRDTSIAALFIAFLFFGYGLSNGLTSLQLLGLQQSTRFESLSVFQRY